MEDLAGRSSDEIEYQPFAAFDEKWTRYFIDACDARVLNALYGDERLVPFSDIALINVGVTTGNNSFFSLADETSAAYELDDLTLPLIGRSSWRAGREGLAPKEPNGRYGFVRNAPHHGW